jgi:pimeloyl-ACP methyl ester carboxylesterase
MKYMKFGVSDNPTIVLLHGGGLSWWSLKEVIEDLQTQYHVVTPIIDGHGDDGETTFTSISDSARKLISYIDTYCHGKVFALGGLSIGAQIVTEIISMRAGIAEYAIIESALVYPVKGTTALTVPVFKLFYGLIRKRWFSKVQAKTLFVSSNMFEQYYKDSLNISKQSLINISLSNGNYNFKNSISDFNGKVLIIVGEKELSIMLKSARTLHDMISNSQLYIRKKMRHGEISLVNSKEYLALIKSFFVK